MNLTASKLSPELQRLVDHRLDAIEHILLQSQTPRAERRSILEDIETQILEMVAAEVPDQEPMRDDLLRVFSKLDPPEAFSGDQVEAAQPTALGAKAARTHPAVRAASRPTYTPVSILACIGGLTTLILGLPSAAMTMFLADSEAMMLLPAALMALIGLPALVLGILYAIAIRNSRGQLRGLTCAALGISALPISLSFVVAYYLIVAFQDWGFILIGIVAVILAVVGSIHLTYRALELFVGTLSHRKQDPTP